MLKKSLFAIGSMMTLVALGGCASTTIYPMGHNMYSLVATSSSEGTAEKAAEKKAADLCQKKGMNLKVLDHESTYQGVNKNDKAMMNLAGTVLTGNMYSADSNNDYKVNLKFKCV